MLVLQASALPVLEGALSLAARNLPGGAKTNQGHFGARVTCSDAVIEPLRLVVFDPQTSGGLLMTVLPEAGADVVARLAAVGVDARMIGRVEARDPAGALVRFV
jgi:selenide,water dikinase